MYAHQSISSVHRLGSKLFDRPSYEQFGWVNMCAITFLSVDQSSSRDLDKFGEIIPPSPKVIGVYTLNFRPKLKFLQLSFFEGSSSPLGGGTR